MVQPTGVYTRRVCQCCMALGKQVAEKDGMREVGMSGKKRVRDSGVALIAYRTCRRRRKAVVVVVVVGLLVDLGHEEA